jgi:DNA (cytosine-5)-methyltransferase 1
VRILKESKEVYGQLPMGFMLENVKNLKTHDNKRTYQIILDSLTDLGYHVDSKIYNSLQFGVAQSRERIYIVGLRSPELLKAFSWPVPTHQPHEYAKVRDILEKQVEPRHYYNGKPLYDLIKHEVTNPSWSTAIVVRMCVLNRHAPTLVANIARWA